MLLVQHDQYKQHGGMKEAAELYKGAATRDRTRDLQIFSLTLSQLSYRGHIAYTHPRTTKIALYTAYHDASTR